MRFRRPTRALVLLATLAALLGAATPAWAAPGDWWQFGWTAAGTRFNPNETTITQGNVGTLGIAAQQVATLGGGLHGDHASAVAVANGRAYVQTGHYESGGSALLAYDTGSLQPVAGWQRQRSGCASDSPTVHLGMVFVGSVACRPSGDDGGVRAFDGATGKQLWYSHALGLGNGTEDASNVAATDGAVYFSMRPNAVYGGDDELVSLDARTGAVRWRVAGGFGPPAVAGGRVFAGASSGLQARSSSTGGLLWTRPQGTVGSFLAVTGGVVYSTGFQNGAWRLFARSVSTGALRWRRALPGHAALAVADGRVLAATGSGLRALDAATGALRWNVTVAVAVGAAPAVANGVAYLGLRQGIAAWRLSDGVRRWRFGSITYGSPAVSGGRLYVSAERFADGQTITVVDQFALGATLPETLS